MVTLEDLLRLYALRRIALQVHYSVAAWRRGQAGSSRQALYHLSVRPGSCHGVMHIDCIRIGGEGQAECRQGQLEYRMWTG